MRTTERAPERTTTLFGGPPGCLLLGIPFMAAFYHRSAGLVVTSLRYWSAHPKDPDACVFESRKRFRSREVGCWAPWLNLHEGYQVALSPRRLWLAMGVSGRE